MLSNSHLAFFHLSPPFAIVLLHLFIQSFSRDRSKLSMGPMEHTTHLASEQEPIASSFPTKPNFYGNAFEITFVHYLFCANELIHSVNRSLPTSMPTTRQNYLEPVFATRSLQSVFSKFQTTDCSISMSCITTLHESQPQFIDHPCLKHASDEVTIEIFRVGFAFKIQNVSIVVATPPCFSSVHKTQKLQ